MTAMRPARGPILSDRLRKIMRSYGAFSVLLTNTLLLVIAANILVWPFADREAAVRRAGEGWEGSGNEWVAKYGMTTIRKVYPGLSDEEKERVLGETGGYTHWFSPYIHLNPEPRLSATTAIHREGFRWSE